jgi:PKD repeat protein
MPGCGIHMNGDASMGGDGVISQAVVERNVIYENGAVRGGSGINGDGVSDSVIRNNLLYNNHASGLSLYAIDAAEGSSRNLIYNNTLVVPSDGRWAVNIPAADGGQASPTGNSIVNNVLYNNHSWHGVITVYGPTALAGSDYNVVMDRFGYPDDSTVIDLAAWQALGFDAHSLLATPDQLFVDAAGNDYHLKSGSPAIGTGTTLAQVTNDLDGAARPVAGPFDIGCYQTGGEPAAPAADFTADVRSGAKPLTVTFQDISTGVPTTWLWDFGDGSTSAEESPTHAYAVAGHFAVTLAVSNGAGDDSETKTDFVKVATFTDVLPESWAWEQVEACVAGGVVQGYADGCYWPSLSVTRDQMAVYITRALVGGDANVPTASAAASFTDVPSDHWAYRYVEYAAANDVVKGYEDGTYRPIVEVTRDQMAVYVARAIATPTGDAGLVGYVPASPRNFTDVPSDFWAYKYVEYCVENGVVQGYGDGLYHPEVVVTRDQMAVYVARAFALEW